MYIITPTLVIWVNGGPLKYQRSLMSIERKIEDQQKPLTSSYCPVRRHPQWGPGGDTRNMFIYRYRSRQRQRCAAMSRPSIPSAKVIRPPLVSSDQRQHPCRVSRRHSTQPQTCPRRCDATSVNSDTEGAACRGGFLD